MGLNMSEFNKELPQDVLNLPLPKFPGMKLFSEDQAAQLARSIKDKAAIHPRIVNSICEAEEIDLDASGSPQAGEKAKIEHGIQLVGCASYGPCLFGRL